VSASRIAVITGTTHGIGRVTARELATAGFAVVMLCRYSAAGAAVREEILSRAPGAALHVLYCDLASLESERGARTTLHLALSKDVALINGRYFDENQCIQPASALASDPELQEALWAASERFTGREPAPNQENA